MAKLEAEIGKETYIFSKLENWIKRQIKSFNAMIKPSSKALQLQSLADLDYLLIPIN